MRPNIFHVDTEHKCCWHQASIFIIHFCSNFKLFHSNLSDNLSTKQSKSWSWCNVICGRAMLTREVCTHGVSGWCLQRVSKSTTKSTISGHNWATFKSTTSWRSATNGTITCMHRRILERRYLPTVLCLNFVQIFSKP